MEKSLGKEWARERANVTTVSSSSIEILERVVFLWASTEGSMCQRRASCNLCLLLLLAFLNC